MFFGTGIERSHGVSNRTERKCGQHATGMSPVRAPRQGEQMRLGLTAIAVAIVAVVIVLVATSVFAEETAMVVDGGGINRFGNHLDRVKQHSK